MTKKQKPRTSQSITHREDELFQSLQYASLIQAALLPPSKQINRIFPSHFIVYLPKDIVSGDFYWITKKGEWIYFAAADCTGHGVPGALMSILGITFLNEILSTKSFLLPNRVLNMLREKIMKALHQTGEHDHSKDGMDISLCAFNTQTKILHYSGANNPFYYFRNNALHIIKGDRMPIGISGNEERSFANHKLQLKEKDMLYIFSDGYADQFGGPDGKKLKANRFKELLTLYHTKNLKVQKEALLNELIDWMEDHEQVDDILIMGLRV